MSVNVRSKSQGALSHNLGSDKAAIRLQISPRQGPFGSPDRDHENGSKGNGGDCEWRNLAAE